MHGHNTEYWRCLRLRQRRSCRSAARAMKVRTATPTAETAEPRHLLLACNGFYGRPLRHRVVPEAR